MAKVYMITEEEMQSLLESLELAALKDGGHMRNNENLDHHAQNAISSLHRTFHYVAVRWAQAVGFSGYRK